MFGGFSAVQVVDAVGAPGDSRGFTVAVDVVCSVTMFALVLFVTTARAEHWPLRRKLTTLAFEALISYLPLIVLHAQWAGMGSWLAGSALLLLPGWAAWPLFAAILGTALGVSIGYGLTAIDVVYFVAATWDVGLMVFGLARLAQLVRYVHATRAELAQLAIVRERMRFARDLHDLLGYSLSAITLKAELTRRLVATNPARARDELAGVLDISRQALADVRTVASGYRSISLSKEASSVASLLATAGIDARVDIGCGPLDERVDTALATVLREAATNLLRHSTARRCVVEAVVVDGLVQLRVRNDGLPRSAATGRRGGGLENLATRLKAVGGRLNVEITADGWFSVVAEVPSAAPKGPIRLTADGSGSAQSGSVRSDGVRSNGVRPGSVREDDT